MKRLFLILLAGILFTTWIPAQENPDEIEVRLAELHTQFVTLEQYAPREFPDFKELEIAHQLLERLDFNRRKFELLVSMYNLMEDELFPALEKRAESNVSQRSLWLKKVSTYGGEGEMGLLSIQRKINSVALLIERLEKQIQRLRESELQKELLSATAMEKRPAYNVSTAMRLRQMDDDLEKFIKNLNSEKKKLEELVLKQTEQKTKISEKKQEIKRLAAETGTESDPVKRRIKNVFTQVREIRLNGLEIPRLNTTQTFVYITGNRIHTLEERIASTRNDMEDLKIQRRHELRNQLLHGFLVILIALAIIFLLTRIARKIVGNVMKKVDCSDHLDDHHKQRYQTLSSVLLSIAKVTLWILGALWILGELNIDYAPFLVAAGGLSLAIGFGAQSLVKDFFSGFFMLMEEQLALGDVVDINGKVGTVEKISFRTIRMRSLDGTVHIIPNGNVSSVSNLTHKWSTAVVNIGVSYDHDADTVLGLLNGICEDVYEDKSWKPILVDKPIAQGIISFGDSAVNFRILAKTAPGMQWAVGRELNMRIKQVFDAKGIEIPYQYVNVINQTPKAEPVT